VCHANIFLEIRWLIHAILPWDGLEGKKNGQDLAMEVLPSREKRDADQHIIFAGYLGGCIGPAN
jgi:hypothetical protein